MVTNAYEQNCYEFRGLSSDQKPTKEEYETLGNGSIFFEMDTCKVFAYNEDSETWIEI